MIGIYSTAVCSNPTETVESGKEFWAASVGTPCGKAFLASPTCHLPSICEGLPAQTSLLTKLPSKTLDGILLCYPLRLFCDAFGQAFLGHIHNMVMDGGFLIIPYQEQEKAQLTGFWDIEWLRGILGLEQKLFVNTKYAVFRRSNKTVISTSVFSAFIENTTKLARKFLDERELAKTPAYLDECKEFLVSPNPSAPSLLESKNEMPDLSENLEKFLAYVTYSVLGVSYKTEALRRIAKRYFDKRKDLRVLNIGGGMGLVDIELLLTCPGVCNVTNCEPIAESLPVTRFLFSEFHNKISGRYQFALCTAQDYPFDQKCDIISDFAALLYVPRKQLETTLDRAWASLRDRGVFVIHENIRRPIFENKSYYKKVFLAEELDSYLSKYGEIEYFRSSDIYPIKKNNVKDTTVFRVVQKK